MPRFPEGDQPGSTILLGMPCRLAHLLSDHSPFTMPTHSELVRLAETTNPPSGLDDEDIRRTKKENPNALNGTELRWRHYQAWLSEHGYLLRPRYNPSWQPPDQNTYAEREDCLEQPVRARDPADSVPEFNVSSQNMYSTPPAYPTGCGSY